MHPAAIDPSAAAMIPCEGHRIAAETGDLEIFADPLIFNVFFTLIEQLVRNGNGRCGFTLRFFEDQEGGHLTCEGDADGERMPHELRARPVARGSTNGGLAVVVTREILGITGMELRPSDLPGSPVWFEITVPKEMFRRGSLGNCDPQHPVREWIGG
jgi:hypothetical protein